MNSLVADNIDSIKKLCEKYQVKSMYLFGSGARDELQDNSDIDILITFREISIEQYTDNYFNLHYELEDLFNRTVDLLTENSLANPYLIKSIEETKQLLYAA